MIKDPKKIEKLNEVEEAFRIAAEKAKLALAKRVAKSA